MRANLVITTLVALFLIAPGPVTRSQVPLPPTTSAGESTDFAPDANTPAAGQNAPAAATWDVFRGKNPPPLAGDSANQSVATPPDLPVNSSPHLAGPLAARDAMHAKQTARVGAAGEMIGFSMSDGSGSQTITLVHTAKSWMAVYHIDRSGTIRLVSSRPIDADFALQLNATSPLPEEIRHLGGP